MALNPSSLRFLQLERDELSEDLRGIGAGMAPAIKPGQIAKLRARLVRLDALLERYWAKRR